MLARTPWVKPVKAQKPKPRRLNRDRRRYLVETAARILKHGVSSKFALEADCRHGLRQNLCLEGWNWQDAETTAKEIVDTALNRIGAQRPSWKEGQPEYTQDGFAPIERTRCVRCHGRLPEGHFKYCSDVCATGHRRTMEDRTVREARNARVYAYYEVWSQKQPEQPCEQCGTPFRPQRPGRRFCSKLCANRHNSGMTRDRP
ncbi:hypothetical protein JYP49_05540 [Nitratireductor aquimarinus]|uniref:hypothetical protein n=1 Tax=Nitratireductor TaxID=245876 RepID=UPI0019D3B819|nr:MULTISPECIES: hypothetical protein [Nitratireductor]MBN7776708.1 hypothetical protein [Nitratireductor pacificus]MBN7780042.1 hypothetical protein [Nitratireductor pacificus]MBN7788849.1 hypothetical protein [Nitratireductor aquimarinus]MBY6098917.1 hypothetical protein [Nitratireductor aquimarinus]MCA1259423.1 hypothetical protein [Nitratireductor aquimarinus]